MSVLAEFFIASDDLAPTYDPSTWPASDVHLSGGLLPMHLELLWAILQSREWDVDLADEFTPIGDFDGEEAWMVRLPADLITRLAQATPQLLDATRIEWAKTEELSVDPEEIRDVMAALQQLAKSAVSSGKSVYLYGSL